MQSIMLSGVLGSELKQKKLFNHCLKLHVVMLLVLLVVNALSSVLKHASY